MTSQKFSAEFKTGIINAGKNELINLTDETAETIEEYGSCNRVVVQNNHTTITISVNINCWVHADDSVGEWGNSRTILLPPQCVLELEPADNCPAYNIVVHNEDGADNLAAGDIIIKADNMWWK
jgi:hypothetical protein